MCKSARFFPFLKISQKLKYENKYDTHKKTHTQVLHTMKLTTIKKTMKNLLKSEEKHKIERNLKFTRAHVGRGTKKNCLVNKTKTVKQNIYR